MHGEAAHVGLVDHAEAQRPVQGPVSAPVEIIRHDDAFRHPRHVRGRREGEVAPGRRLVETARIGKAPGEAAGHGFHVGVEEELVAVEPMAFLRLVGPVHPVEKKPPRADVLQEHVPYVAGLVQPWVKRNLVGRLGVLRAVEQEEGDCGGVPAEDGKLGPMGPGCGAKRQRAAGRPHKLFLGDDPLPRENLCCRRGRVNPAWDERAERRRPAGR